PQQLADQQTSGSQPPESDPRSIAFLQPDCLSDEVLQPEIPARLAEVAGTVATAELVGNQNRITEFRKPPRLQRDHAAGFVQFLGEWMDIQNRAPRASFTRRV